MTVAWSPRGVLSRHTGRRAAEPAPPQDAKSALQEWAQARGLSLPTYRVVEREGPDHAPVFTVAVEVSGKPSAVATGASKRVAEQAAARMLLEEIETDG